MAEKAALALAFNQRALWFMFRLDASISSFNLTVCLRTQAEIDHIIMHKALVTLLESQPILRSRYKENSSGDPVRIELSTGEEALDFEFIKDAPNFPKMRHLLDSLSKQPFDLTTDRPVRTRLYSHEDKSTTLFFCVHDINFGGNSRSVLLTQLQWTYEQLKAGKTPGEFRRVMKYDDYVREESEFLNTAEANKQLDYWLSKLSGDIPVIALPIDRQRPLIQTFSGGTHRFDLDRGLREAVSSFAKTENVSERAIYFAAFYLLLRSYSNQEDIVIGTGVTLHEPRFSNTVGNFLNKVALRPKVGSSMSIKAMLREMESELESSFASSRFPFALLVEKLRIPREPGRSPVFQADFTYVDLNDPKHTEMSSESQIWTFERVEQQEGQFELSSRVVRKNDDTWITFQFNSDLFEVSTIESMASTYLAVLNQLVRGTKGDISDLEIVSETQRRRLLVEFNNTSFKPRLQTVTELFSESVNAHPDKIAVVYQGQNVSYAELDRSSNRVANHLVSAGLKRGEPVGVYMEASIETMVAMIGAIKAGGAYLPLDSAMPSNRLDFILEDSKARFLLVRKALSGTGISFKGEVLNISDRQAMISASADAPADSPTASDALYVIYTSGTTGNPKGVIIEHKCLANYVQWFRDQYKIDSNSKAALLTSYAYDLGYTTLWTTILSGGELHMLPDTLTRDMTGLIDYFADNNINFIKLISIATERSDVFGDIYFD